MKSEAWQRGFEKAKAMWEKHCEDSGRDHGFNPANPFPIGTESEEGFEEFVYQVTQK